MNCAFSFKDIGKLHYFLSLEVSYTTNSLFLSQAKYASNIPLCDQLHEIKSTATPMVSGQQLRRIGNPFNDTTFYRSLLGALDYFTITLPINSFAVNHVR